MKPNFKHLLLVLAIAFAGTQLKAQEVNTLYFLENSPHRHYINPAIQPISNFYLSLPILGYTSFWGGINGQTINNINTLTMSDIIVKQNGKTMWGFSKEAGGMDAFLKKLKPATAFEMSSHIDLLALGVRIKDAGYFHLNLSLKSDMDAALPKGFFEFMLGGGMKNDYNTFDLKQLGVNANAYTELGIGYSHQINEQWAVGGKVNLMLGLANLSVVNQRFDLNMNAPMSSDIQSIDDWEWALRYNGILSMSLPLTQLLPESTDQAGIDAWKNQAMKDLGYDQGIGGMVKKLFKTIGLGAGIDLGLTYKPIEQLQISAGVTDLGIIRWGKGTRHFFDTNARFDGVHNIDYNQLTNENGEVNLRPLLDSASVQLLNIVKTATSGANVRVDSAGYWRGTSPKLNIGVDANFWDNRVGVGIVSQTRFHNNRVYEEVTIGASFRPVHWFQIAASYSILNNGRGSHFGAALGFVTYEGIGLTLAADYIPTSYAKFDPKNVMGFPYKTNTLNLAMGLNIVIGHSRDKDKDGVKDRYDLCPNTPRGVKVDEEGCPLDTDGDGVPDYLDECPDTPSAARDFVDEDGCPIDSDGDGVPDYLDKCPDTPAEAFGTVDENGCPKDSDGDGVPDYLDKCPDTPKQAKGLVDKNGCEKDTDGDGVADWRDKCPDTPKSATVDENGCEQDTDGDGVPDWRDDCPNTPREAAQTVNAINERGCEKDTDEDGVPDWRDKCPGTPKGATVDKNGCEQDTDGDGVPDWRDECPDTPREAAQVAHAVDSVGCLKDSDGDEVPDYLDACPLIAGSKDNRGCPEIKREIRNLLKKAMQGIQFETGKADIKPVSFPLLDQIAEAFIDNPTWKIEVQGHTDNVGKADYNQDLSERRANAVRNYLIKAGVPEERMTAKGYGLTMPIADNKTAAGRKENRRVEFIITFEEVSYETVKTIVE